MVYEGLNSAQYGSQKVLLNYFMFRNSDVEKCLNIFCNNYIPIIGDFCNKNYGFQRQSRYCIC